MQTRHKKLADASPKSTPRSSILRRQMTRKQFLGLSAVALASVFGITGILEELKSHAATPFLSTEPETGAVTAPATTVTDAAASNGKAVTFGTSPPPTGKQRTWLAGPDAGSNGTATGFAAWQKLVGYYPQVYCQYYDYESSFAQYAADITSQAPGQFLPPKSDGSVVNVFTIGLFPGTGGTSVSGLEHSAAGGDVAGWTTVANAIKKIGYDSPSTVLRIGHECDGNWYPWGTGGNQTNMQNYAKGFAHAVTAVRAVCPSVKFELNFAAGGGTSSIGNNKLATTYPGDAYVDIIGFDYYNNYAATTAAMDAENSALGFGNVPAFAAAHGKKFSISEWGVVSDGSTKSGNDIAAFMTYMFDNFQTVQTKYHNLSHEVYFNVGVNALPNWPKSLSTYKSLWNS